MDLQRISVKLAFGLHHLSKSPLTTKTFCKFEIDNFVVHMLRFENPKNIKSILNDYNIKK